MVSARSADPLDMNKLPRPMSPGALGIDQTQGIGLVRVVDRERHRHAYGADSLPRGELVGELGSLLRDPSEDSVPARLTADGRLQTDDHPLTVPRPSLYRAIRWALAPAGWRRVAPSGARGRAILRRLVLSLRRLAGGRETGGDGGPVVGYLHRRAGAARLPLYAATHPVTGDQLLTTSPREPEDLGYASAELLGYLTAEAPVTGQLGLKAPALPWARRFGKRVPSERPGFTGSIDWPRSGEAVLPEPFAVSGWAMVPSGAASRVELRLSGTPVGRASLGMPRPDVARAMPHPEAGISGFEMFVDPASLPGDELLLEAVAYDRDGSSAVIDAVTAFRLPKRGFEDFNGLAAGLRARVSAIDRGPVAGRIRPRSGEPIRVLSFTHRLDEGGAQRYLFDLLRRLSAEPDLSFTVVTSHQGSYGPRLEALGIPVHMSPGGLAGGVAEYEGKVAEVAAWASGQGFDLVFANTLDSHLGVDLAARLGLPSIWAIHESFELPVWFTLNHGSRRAPQEYPRQRAERALGSAAAVVFAADATRELYQPYGDPRRHVTLPYGVELDEIRRHRQGLDPTALRRERGISESATVVLCLGSIVPRKAQVVLANAFSRVASAHPDALLVLVGDQAGPYSEALKEYVERAGLGPRTRILPVDPDPYSWHQVADVFALASNVESSPLAVIEAMAFETPVVATRVFGLPELVEDGRTGYLCDPSEVTELARCLDRALVASSEERRSIGRAAGEHVRARHDPARYAARFRRLLDGVLEDPRALPGEMLDGAAPRAQRLRRSVTEKISVLIPTLDAGPEFADVLDSLAAQEGLTDVEVLVLDSGSSDDTVELARGRGARILEVPAGEFNHGGVRNRLAESAAGDVLLLTVQDARLVGTHAIRDLVLAMRGDSSLAAVSARQVAGPDADLYSRYRGWLRNEEISANATRTRRTRSLLVSRAGWAESLVDNVCAAIRRSAWESVRFRELDFAEDIDFGLRATERGWTTAFCDHVRVEHHHDRGASRTLFRSALHRSKLWELAGDLEPDRTATIGAGALVAAIPTVIRQVEASVGLTANGQATVSLGPALRAVAEAFGEEPPPLEATGELAGVCELVDGRADPNPGGIADLRAHVLIALDFPWLRNFALAWTEPVPRRLFHDFVARLVAARIGELVGDATHGAPDPSLVGQLGERV